MSRASVLAQNDQEVQDFVLKFKLRPFGPTSGQFLSDDSLASTEFVQRALGSYSGIVGYTAAGTLTLTAADIGKHIVVNNAATIVLPAANSAVPGSTLHILVSGVTDAVVTRAGTDVISRNDALTVSSIPVKANTSIILRQGLGGTAWIVCGGDASLMYSPLFAASLGSPGFSKSPSGLIEMWGLTGGAAPGAIASITFPQAFPNACLNIQLTYVDGGVQAPATRGGPSQSGSSSRTGFNYSHSGSSSASQHFWRAIGF